MSSFLKNILLTQRESIFFLGTPDRMSMDRLKQKLQAMGTIPGLSDWQKNLVLLRRCQDIDQKEFEARLQALYSRVEKLYEESLPESLDEETYLMSKEYYDCTADMLDHYLNGMDALYNWSESSNSRFLQVAAEEFERGDKLSAQVLVLSLEAEYAMIDTAKALLKSVGHDLSEGIG